MAYTQAVASLKSLTPYSQSRHHSTPHLDKEIERDYELRTWAERLHVNTKGNVFIPPGAFTNSILESAKFLSIQIPGKGKATYTKHFEAGVRVIEPLTLSIKKSDVKPEELFLNSDGKRGGGKRVIRYYPRIDAWEGDVTYWITDATITQDVFERVLEASGTLIGIGRFRPRNLGFYGRFEVINLVWRSIT